MGKPKKTRLGEDVTEEVAEEEVEAPRIKKKKAKKGEQQEVEQEAPTPKPKKSKRREEAEEGAEEPEALPAPAKRKKGGEQVTEASVVDVDGEEPSAKKNKKKGRRRDDAGEAAEGGQEEPLHPGDDDRPPKKEKKKRRSEEDEAEQLDADEQPGGKEAGSKKAKKRGGGEGAEEASPALEPLTVFVGGIPWSCTSEILRRDFGDCGEVTDVNLLMDRVTGKSRGIAYVTFADKAGVKAALKFDGDDYGGRTLKVVIAEASAVREGKIASGAYEVFVRGLPADTSEDSLRTRFSSCGTIARLNLPTRGSGKCKGFAWLTFTSKADMEKAVKLNGTESGSAKLLVEAAGEHKSVGGAGAAKGKGKGKGKVSTEREVFVSNLPYEAQEADLRKDFSECGEIERMHMPMRDSKSMGFAWITFTTEESMDRALSYNGDDYGGRRLRVEKSGQHKAGGGKGKDGGKGTDD